MPRSRWPAALALAVLAARAAPARAVVLSEDPLEERSTEIGVVLRSFAFLLAGTVLEPPVAPEDASPSTIATLDARVYFVERRPPFKLVVHGDLVSETRSHAAAGIAPVGRGPRPPRWLPLAGAAVDDPTLVLRGGLDWVYASWSGGPVTVTAGRQPVTFGRGLIFRPVDRVAPFVVTEVDTEYKPGVDALRLDLAPTPRFGLTLLATVGERDEDHDLEADLAASSFVARAKLGFGRGEAALLAGLVRADVFLAADGVVDLRACDLYGAATLTIVTQDSLDPPAEGVRAVPQALVGVAFRPHAGVQARAEALYNGFGAWDADDFLPLLLSERLAAGEQVTLGRLAAAVLADWEVEPRLHLRAGAILAPVDPSAYLLGGLFFDLAGNAELSFGGYAPVGRRPRVDAGFEPRSELGLYPWFGYLELKAVI